MLALGLSGVTAASLVPAADDPSLSYARPNFSLIQLLFALGMAAACICVFFSVVRRHVLRRVFAGGSSDGTDGRPGRRFADNGNIVLVAVPNSRAFANRNCLSKEQIAALPLANYEPIATPQHAESGKASDATGIATTSSSTSSTAASAAAAITTTLSRPLSFKRQKSTASVGSASSGKDEQPQQQQQLQGTDSSAMKKSKYTAHDDTCAICLEQYTPGEHLRVLPCQNSVAIASAACIAGGISRDSGCGSSCIAGATPITHRYHPECIDGWLHEQTAICPICKVVVTVSPTAAAAAAAATSSATSGQSAWQRMQSRLRRHATTTGDATASNSVV
eukprot:6857-Heterococcus_DN1.PRE.4